PLLADGVHDGPDVAATLQTLRRTMDRNGPVRAAVAKDAARAAAALRDFSPKLQAQLDRLELLKQIAPKILSRNDADPSRSEGAQRYLALSAVPTANAAQLEAALQ